MKTRPLLCFFALVFSLAPLSAQAPSTGAETPGSSEPDSGEPGKKDAAEETPGPERFWQAVLPGGQYRVALDRISSVSRHKYLLDGALIVDEVTIDTLGEALTRFYFIIPVTSGASASNTGKLASQVTDKAQEAFGKTAGQAGTNLQDMVVKKYPETTHARTIEYRILSESQLTSLFESASKAWESGKGRKITVK